MKLGKKLLEHIKNSRYFNFSIKIRLNEVNIKVPLINGLGLIDPTEEWMVDVLKVIMVKSKGKFIDVGANIGQTLIKVKSIRKDMQYIGFEPNPECAYYLKCLIKKNKWKDVTIVPVGISAKTEILNLNFYVENETTSAGIIENFRGSNNIISKEPIPVFSFSDISKNINLSDLAIVKIDVEGAELEVLKSLEPLLIKDRPFLLMEILPVYNENNKFRLERQIEIEHILSQNSYKTFQINKDKKGNFRGFKFLEKIGVHSDIKQSDYLFCPSECEDILSKSN